MQSGSEECWKREGESHCIVGMFHVLPAPPHVGISEANTGRGGSGRRYVYVDILIYMHPAHQSYVQRSSPYPPSPPGPYALFAPVLDAQAQDQPYIQYATSSESRNAARVHPGYRTKETRSHDSAAFLFASKPKIVSQKRGLEACAGLHKLSPCVYMQYPCSQNMSDPAHRFVA